MSHHSNSPIQMVELENRGRALVSTKPLKAGEILLKESPILLYSALPSAAAANYCSHCYRTIASQSTTTLSCPNCSAASQFCSPQCQSAALSTSHTPFVCSALRRLCAADSPLLLQHHHDRLIQARFLIAAYNLAIASPPKFQTLISLQGDALADDASVFLHSVISTICQLPNSGELGVSVELTAALLAKDKLNAFGLMEPFNQGKERSVRAYGLYPTASFFNHDCLPNACRFDYVDSASEFSNTDITIRVIHDLPAGREICLSYFPVNFKYVERQQRLKEDYGFVCDCDRCKVEANWSDDEEEGEGEMNRDVGDDDMDEDGDDEEGDLETTDSGMDKEGEDDSFPHAYFFIRYMCSVDNCGGTLAPVPPVDARPSTVMECNVCGSFSKCED
ncbi:histone-lysine N-methyltransferase ASHR2-like [Salvia splendens]|uniref:histone-lysine N-methyltransferase ASHR2-like n=1 Tax=Salvia splendens TaxID=180675 RepID=UPI001C275971|nr:histone-lysine N-methyltransferase ASHR2-like [Salvia splendens]XP_042056607.1 histone-lysine N-methyltransferase ASHR2-like [Salvia splendens]XP_042056608.1 histone-lysine N-methyltransferase ASHR2-like [Salvia splendens]XP_042056610.1 histone-lysine N-methyltransferase ASHR2-like [Salvia splendens]XP_042056611.1 histone-lysine N-methyltransferase ASHR2-like [Salvia splendens]